MRSPSSHCLASLLPDIHAACIGKYIGHQEYKDPEIAMDPFSKRAPITTRTVQLTYFVLHRSISGSGSPDS